MLKRFYSVWKKKHFRADHAHKKCTQIIIPIRGKVKLIIKSRNYNKIFELTVKKREQFSSLLLIGLKFFLIVLMMQS